MRLSLAVGVIVLLVVFAIVIGYSAFLTVD
jgi:hypothetical protein